MPNKEYKITVGGAHQVRTAENVANQTTDVVVIGGGLMQVSDGHHTMDELYEHRIVLFIALCRRVAKIPRPAVVAKKKSVPEDFDERVWCSVKHSDGSTFGDWFVLGIGKNAGRQVTYHLPARYWSEVTEFAEVLETAPEFDDHTPADVLERLAKL